CGGQSRGAPGPRAARVGPRVGRKAQSPRKSADQPDMSAQHALAGEARESSGVTSRLLLCYLDRVGGREAIDAVLARCGLADAEAELWDENTWFSFETKIRLFE